VTVNYRKIDQRDYETSLINALAAGEGPDIFMIRNRALPRMRDKLIQVHPQQMSVAKLRELFPTIVEQDFCAERRRDITRFPFRSIRSRFFTIAIF